jgi:hypothetical protein
VISSRVLTEAVTTAELRRAVIQPVMYRPAEAATALGHLLPGSEAEASDLLDAYLARMAQAEAVRGLNQAPRASRWSADLAGNALHLSQHVLEARYAGPKLGA